MRCTSVGHVPCSPSSWFSSTKSPAVELGCICLAFKAHFLLLHKEASVKWTVSSSQRGHKFFGCFIEPQLDEKPWKPKAIFWILRNPFLLSSRAALIPWDSGSGVLAVGRWADGGVFSFLYRSSTYRSRHRLLLSVPSASLKRKWFVCKGSCREPFSVRQAHRSQSRGPECPAVPERPPCAHTDGHNVSSTLKVVSAEWSDWSKSRSQSSDNTSDSPAVGCYANCCSIDCAMRWFSLFSCAFTSFLFKKKIFSGNFVLMKTLNYINLTQKVEKISLDITKTRL